MGDRASVHRSLCLVRGKKKKDLDMPQQILYHIWGPSLLSEVDAAVWERSRLTVLGGIHKYFDN